MYCEPLLNPKLFRNPMLLALIPPILLPRSLLKLHPPVMHKKQWSLLWKR